MSAFRTARQLTSASSRLRFSSRALFRSPILATKVARPSAGRAFSGSTQSFSASADRPLVQKLKEELQYEVDSAPMENTPEFLAAFQADGLWKIQDTPGNDEVFMTRQFGDESIRVMFSIADLHDLDADLEDEHTEDGEPKEPGPEFRVSVSITKPTAPSALNIDLYCAEGAFHPATVSFYKTAALGRDLTIESDFSRRTLYVGPLFEMLDATLQEQFTTFFQERGIDEHLAHFVPQYAEWKEQKEYVDWLKNVSDFVAA
ncbi:mitochondrial glycoprotein [Mycena crocata]|nr:mitochondrial glycoprotein [Mycena crocata]